jgi:hypothetical protein
MAQEEAGVAQEEFEEVALIWDGTLAMRRSDTYPPELWILKQRSHPVAAITRTRSGWSLATASQRWNATIRRRRHRLGWHIEVTPPGTPAPVLDYQPATLRSGGTLELPTGGRYKLRRLVGGGDWILTTASRHELARIAWWIKPPSGSALAHDQTGLRPAAAHEPDLTLLLAAACAAIAAQYEQPAGGAMGGGI